jgi:hypothetical protein
MWQISRAFLWTYDPSLSSSGALPSYPAFLISRQITSRAEAVSQQFERQSKIRKRADVSSAFRLLLSELFNSSASLNDKVRAAAQAICFFFFSFFSLSSLIVAAFYARLVTKCALQGAQNDELTLKCQRRDSFVPL